MLGPPHGAVVAPNVSPTGWAQPLAGQALPDACRGDVAVSSWVNYPLLPVVLLLPQGFAVVATMNK